MRTKIASGLALMLLAAGAGRAQTTIKTNGDVEAQGFRGDGSQLTNVTAVSAATADFATSAANAATATQAANSDKLDDLDSTEFALDADLKDVETLLLAIQAQVDLVGLAPVEDTGLKECWDEDGVPRPCAGTGEDAEFQFGVAWPTPRFTINESSPGVPDGTVTDNLTELIWLRNADCANTTLTWAEALAFANTLFDGSTAHNGGDCDLSDGSAPGAWRLPNIRELQSLVHYGFYNPAVPNTVGTGQWVGGDPFTDLKSSYYWSSTTDALSKDEAWGVHMIKGDVNDGFKFLDVYVWPVRGGQ